MRRTEETSESDLEDLYEQESGRLWRGVFAYAQDRAVTDDAVAEASTRSIGHLGSRSHRP